MDYFRTLFANPQMLWLLLFTVPLLSLFLWWAWQKKQKLIAQFVQSRLLAQLTVGVSQRRQQVRMALYVAAVACIYLALAQPQWGFAWEEAKQRGLDIVVAIDTSRSMLAEDVPPNRLARAKLAALDLMKSARTDRLGLVAFAGTAFLQCPLTLDDEAFRQSVVALDAGIIPQGGTALAETINTALGAFKDEGDNFKILVLFTDGEDQEEGAVEAAEKASKAGLRIFTVGVGTTQGELVRVKDEQGGGDFLKDSQGNVVKSRLNEALLRQIAEAASGFYLPLRGANTIEALYKQGLAPLPKSDIASTRFRHYHQRFQWPLGLAIVLLVSELFLPEHKRVARNQAILDAPNAELRKAVALLLACALPLTALASPTSARKKYQAGEYEEALDEYQRLAEKKPDDQRLYFNAGASAYKANKYDEAAKDFAAALQSQDLNLQQSAYYNLGNTLYQRGEQIPEPAQKMEAWEMSAKSYESALKLNSKDEDARHNLEFVKKKLEELRKQQPQQNKNKKNEKDKDNKDKDNQDKDDQQDKSQQEQKQEPQDKSKEESKQDQDKAQQQQQQEKSEQEKKEAKSGNKDKEKEPEKEPQPADAGNDQKSDQEENANEQAPARLGQMTPQQAKQLLDAQKGDEKILMYIPADKAKPKNKIFKDW